MRIFVDNSRKDDNEDEKHSVHSIYVRNLKNVLKHQCALDKDWFLVYTSFTFKSTLIRPLLWHFHVIYVAKVQKKPQAAATQK